MRALDKPHIIGVLLVVIVICRGASAGFVRVGLVRDQEATRKLLVAEMQQALVAKEMFAQMRHIEDGVRIVWTFRQVLVGELVRMFAVFE